MAPLDLKVSNVLFDLCSVVDTFRTVFWSLFGRGEPSVVQLNGYDNTLTEDIGYIIYGAYNVASVTVLLNMLIAMMTRSFENIAVSPSYANSNITTMSSFHYS